MFVFAGNYKTMTVFIFAACYFCLATWTYGLYVPSGLFVPVILCGAAWGRMFGDCVYTLFPKGSWSDPGTYALIGSAAMLGKYFYVSNKSFLPDSIRAI